MADGNKVNNKDNETEGPRAPKDAIELC